MNSLPKTVTRQRRGCDLNPGPSVPESSKLTTRLPSHGGGREVVEMSGHIGPSVEDTVAVGVETGKRCGMKEGVNG